MKKVNNIVFIILFLLIIIGGFVKPILMPKDINYTENRDAIKLPKFDFNFFISNEYQNTFEKALADQIPLSGKMKLFEKNMETISKVFYYKILPNNSYYALSSGISLYNNNLVYNPYRFKDLTTSLDNKVNNINRVSNLLKNKVKMYVYYIEKDTDINFESNEKLKAFEYMKNSFNNEIVTRKYEINNFKEFEEYFYKTDHHWNYKGSYKAYKELVKLLTKDEPLNYEEEICLSSKMSGSKASQIGGTKIFNEEFCAYRFNLKKYDVYINGTKKDYYVNKEEVLRNNPNTISYGDYYGWDHGLIRFDFHNPQKDNLLIIGESYDNAVNDLLASHFNNTYNVDLRAYKNAAKNDFNIIKFVAENDIDKILLIGNIDYFTMKTFNLIKEEN